MEPLPRPVYQQSGVFGSGFAAYGFANRLRMALCSEAGSFEGWPAFAELIVERAVVGRLSGYSQGHLRDVSFGLDDVKDWVSLLLAEFAMLQASMSALPLEEGPAAMLQYNMRHGRMDDLFWDHELMSVMAVLWIGGLP